MSIRDATWADDPDAEAPAGAEPERGGRYVLGDEIGRGGLGRVRVAWDRKLRRQVALKELLADGTVQRRRFEREARLTAHLDHPAIVPIHDVGEDPDGRPFYAMKRLHGRSLADALGEARGLADRLEHVEALVTACNAIAYAHERGVVHRDLKPENLVVGRFGETWVVDWGLSARVGSQDAPSGDGSEDPVEPALTSAGTVVGTPAYLSPEQARGEAAAAASDIWALGAVLYTILTGGPPYRGDRATLLAAARRGEVAPVLDRAPDAPPPLAAVCARAMAAEPAGRYPSASALAADLREWSQGRRVSAYEYRPSEALGLVWRQYRAWWLGGALAAGVVGAIAVGAYWRVVRERDAAEAAIAERDQTLAGRYAEAARSSLLAHDLHAAERFAAEALRYRDSPIARGVLAGVALERGPRLVGSREAPEGCAKLAAVGERVACASPAGVRVTDGDGGGFELPGVRPRGLALAPDGRVALLVADQLVVHGPDGLELERRPIPANLGWVAFDPDGHPTWRESEAPRTTNDSPGWCASTLSGVAWDDAGTAWASCLSGTVGRFPVGARVPDPLGGTPEIAYFLALVAPDALVVGASGDAVVLDRATLALRTRLAGPGGLLLGGGPSPDGRFVAAGTDQGRVALWDADGVRSDAFPWTGPGNATVAWAGDGTLWTAGSRPGLRRWSLEELAPPPRLDGGPVEIALDRSTGRVWAVLGKGRQLWTWTLAEGPARRVRVLDGPVGGVVPRDGRILVVNRVGPDLPLWQLEERDGESRAVLRASATVPGGAVPDLAPGIGASVVVSANGEVAAFDPDGTPRGRWPGRLLASSAGALLLERPDGAWWIGADGATERRLDLLLGRARVAVSPDGGLVAYETEGELRIVRAPGGERVAITRIPLRAGGLRFSPDGARLFVPGWDAVVRVVDAADGHVLAELAGEVARMSDVILDGPRVHAFDWSGRGWSWDVSGLDRSAAAVLADAEAHTGLVVDAAGDLRFDAARLGAVRGSARP